MSNDDARPLYWEASYDIVLSLVEQYPDADVEIVGLDQLYRMVIALPDFADNPALANDKILEDILREWYEETDGS